MNLIEEKRKRQQLSIANKQKKMQACQESKKKLIKKV